MDDKGSLTVWDAKNDGWGNRDTGEAAAGQGQGEMGAVLEMIGEVENEEVSAMALRAILYLLVGPSKLQGSTT
jgi:hypothetical protein